MGRNLVEVLMGALVLIIAGFFIFISYKSGNISSTDGYKLTAKFRQVGGLSVGSDVRVGGIKVGTVSNQWLDNDNYLAVIELSINKSVKLPEDSLAAIVSDGFLGGKYLAIDPGGDDKLLEPGDKIKFTQDSVNIEELIGKFAFGSAEKE